IHSYSQSLRHQLKDTKIEVLEIIPPYVQTDLMGGAADPRAMPLKDFIAETMALLTKQPTPPEIAVERVNFLRHAANRGEYDAVFSTLNAQHFE
ncbi:MAG TPA: oxidoreductase, partial [Terracidiphilus sp.]